MRITERFRRGVVIPLDGLALKALEVDDVDETTRVQCIAIADQSDFENIWESGLFQAINRSTGSLVDDHEEELIRPQDVPIVRKTAEAFDDSCTSDSPDGRFVAGLIEASKLAVRAGIPMYFVL